MDDTHSSVSNVMNTLLVTPRSTSAWLDVIISHSTHPHWSQMTGHNKWDLIQLNVWLCQATENVNREEEKKKHSQRLLLSPHCQLSLWLYFSAVILTESLNTFQTSRRCLVSRSLKKLEKQPWVNVIFQKDCPLDCQATQLLEIFEGFQEISLLHISPHFYILPLKVVPLRKDRILYFPPNGLKRSLC